jgi:hypothetical protein
VLKFKEQLYSHINGARRIRAEFKLIAKVINNLELIYAKSSANFGKRVLSEYQSKYPIKLF